MTELASLDLRLGNCRDLSLPPGFGKLRYFQAWKVHGLSALAEVRSLEELFLQDLRQVTSLPWLDKLTRLRRITLDGMRGLTDVSALLTAPALEGLSLRDLTIADVASVNQFAAHPTLCASIHLGTVARTSAVTLNCLRGADRALHRSCRRAR
jgi:hypothetical protein